MHTWPIFDVVLNLTEVAKRLKSSFWLNGNIKEAFSGAAGECFLPQAVLRIPDQCSQGYTCWWDLSVAFSSEQYLNFHQQKRLTQATVSCCRFVKEVPSGSEPRLSLLLSATSISQKSEASNFFLILCSLQSLLPVQCLTKNKELSFSVSQSSSKERIFPVLKVTCSDGLWIKFSSFFHLLETNPSNALIIYIISIHVFLF